jgi:hypothetical protein
LYKKLEYKRLGFGFVNTKFTCLSIILYIGELYCVKTLCKKLLVRYILAVAHNEVLFYIIVVVLILASMLS